MGSLSLALTIVGILLVFDFGRQKLPWGFLVIWMIIANVLQLASALQWILRQKVEEMIKRDIFPS